jgi:hypothetical protein
LYDAANQYDVADRGVGDGAWRRVSRTSVGDRVVVDQDLLRYD